MLCTLLINFYDLGNCFVDRAVLSREKWCL